MYAAHRAGASSARARFLPSRRDPALRHSGIILSCGQIGMRSLMDLLAFAALHESACREASSVAWVGT